MQRQVLLHGYPGIQAAGATQPPFIFPVERSPAAQHDSDSSEPFAGQVP